MKLQHLHEMKIQDHYHGPYGLGYPDNRHVWDDIRNHPLFIDQVLKYLDEADQSIAKIKEYQSDHPDGMRASLMKALGDLGSVSDVAREIAKDVGWGDPNDIIIAIQRHPLLTQKLAERDEIKKRRDNMMAI